MADKLLEVNTMKGSKILGFVCAIMAVTAFAGYMSGAKHQIAPAILLGILSVILFSRKTFTR